MIRAAQLLTAAAFGCSGAIGPPADLQPERSEPLSFSSHGIQFSGTVHLPAGNGPYRAVVVMGGSGPWRPARWYFDHIRDAFRAGGIAVAYYDRRGEGGSGGDFDRASFEDLADDAVAAIGAVRSRPDISDAGLYGHSMGGWIAGLAASRSPSVAFVITAAGPGVGPLEQTLFARANEDRAAGIAEGTVLELADLRSKVIGYYVDRKVESHEIAQAAFDAAQSKPWFPTAARWRELQGVNERLPSPEVLAALDERDPDLLRWFRRDGRYDPAAALERVAVPYLAIFGEADPIVPRQASIVALNASLAAPSLLTIRSYPGANHMIMTGAGQAGSSLAAGYLSDMRAWIAMVR